MKQVAIFNTRIEAEMWCSDLNDHNIPYILQGNDYGGINPLVGMINGIKVLVAENQVEKIKVIKNQFNQS